MRAAQIAYDLKFQGQVVLFTWPAGAKDGWLDSFVSKTYDFNKENAKASIAPFVDFLKVLSESPINLYLAVHSMGHQMVLPAMAQISEVSKEKFIKELILNAPDFEVSQFADIIGKFKNNANRVTVYCSFNDKAISASETYNKNQRLGACEKIEGVDMINVSEFDVPTLGLGHGYYSSRPILTDVYQVLLGIEAEKRLFIRKSEVNASEDYYLRP
jgi:esterase/lipase superfamily enzyme